MTLRTNARLAGWAYLLYFVVGIGDLVLSGRTTAGAVGTAARLASIAQHETLMGVTILLGLFQAVCAVVLGVTLWALTRDQDREVAALGMSFRLLEGASNAVSIARPLALMSLAKASVAAAAADAATTNAAAGLIMRTGLGSSGGAGSFCFGIGSLCFCWLFLRARSIPAWLAWTGVLASVFWVIGTPLDLAGFIGGPASYATWIPMAVFELTFAVWLIAKGIAEPSARRVVPDAV
jgi:hypothetical protein